MIELMAHQKRFVELFRDNPRFAFFAEPGVGKTIATLAAIVDAKQRGYTGRTVILAPKSVMRAAWVADAKHFPSLSVVCCWADKPAERKRLIQSDADVLVMNYEMFKKHVTEIEMAGVTRLVIDESSKVKSPDAQITQACIEFADGCDSVLILSGTPAPNCKTEYWSQMRCVDWQVFGKNFYKFAYHFFYPIKRIINGKERVVQWQLSDEKSEDFMRRLSGKSWTLRKSECLDLPPQTDLIRDVEMSADERRLYESVMDEFVAEFGDGSKMNVNGNAQMMKLRQITGGCLYVDQKPRVIGNSKINAMLEVLDEIGPRKSVIWAQFASEIDRIAEAVRDSGRSVATIDGRTKLADRQSAVEAFQGGDLQVLVCHPAAAGHGITLTAASHAIYYSHDFSFETYQQSRDRIYRKGQSLPTTYYHLISTNSIDRNILKAITRKQTAHEMIMELMQQRGSTDGHQHKARRIDPARRTVQPDRDGGVPLLSA